MDNEISEQVVPAPKKRAPRKSTSENTKRKPRTKKSKDVPESFSTAMDDGITCEYSDTVKLEGVEDWSPTTRENDPKEKEETKSEPEKNTLEKSEHQHRRFQRLPRCANNAGAAENKGTQNQPTQNNRNFQQNRNNNRRRTNPVRIGAFSTGYLRGLSHFENSASLEKFCQIVVDESKPPLNLNEVLEKSNDDLADFASTAEFGESSSRGKIIDGCIEAAVKEMRPVVVRGILESMEGGEGIITYACDNYKIRAKSTFVPHCLIQSLGLRRGQTLTAYVHMPMEQSTCPFALKITEVLGHSPEEAIKFPRFKDLTPYYPTERIFLEQSGNTSGDNLSMRIIDLLSPIGFGQRGLIVAPPRTGKTILLQGIANAIINNQPKAKLIVLLIDERPEEVTDFSRRVKGAEVISSTFDESAESHVHAAEIVIENARRWVEAGEHVIILLDSITRLARAYNTEQPSSGKVLSGGVEANALQLPKRFFGSARNIEGGGSLTIIATALVETGSRMDDVIFEEFKGTGNMELHLDRAISDKRIFPAINIERSGTRKEELLYHPDELTKIYSLRRAFQGVQPVDAMEMLSSRVKKFQTNVEFLMNLNR